MKFLKLLEEIELLKKQDDSRIVYEIINKETKQKLDSYIKISYSDEKKEKDISIIEEINKEYDKNFKKFCTIHIESNVIRTGNTNKDFIELQNYFKNNKNLNTPEAREKINKIFEIVNFRVQSIPSREELVKEFLKMKPAFLDKEKFNFSRELVKIIKENLNNNILVIFTAATDKLESVYEKILQKNNFLYEKAGFGKFFVIQTR